MDVTIEGATGSLTVSNTLMSLGELDLQSPNFQFDDVDGANDGILRSRSPGTQSEVFVQDFLCPALRLTDILGDPFSCLKPHVEMDLRFSAILPGQ